MNCVIVNSEGKMSSVDMISSEESLNWDDVGVNEFVWDDSEVQEDVEVFEMSKYSTFRISSCAALGHWLAVCVNVPPGHPPALFTIWD